LIRILKYPKFSCSLKGEGKEEIRGIYLTEAFSFRPNQQREGNAVPHSFPGYRRVAIKDTAF
jgi:hypothetical protein